MRSREMGVAFVTLALAAVLAGCLPFPLGDPDKSRVDMRFAGQWLFEEDGSGTLLTAYPFDARTFVVEHTDFKAEGGKKRASGRKLYKAWLTDVRGKTFMTLDPLDQRLPAHAGKGKAYPAVRLTHGGDSVEMRLVDGDFAGFKSVKSSQDVAAVFNREVDNPALFGDNKPLTLRRVDAERDKDLLRQLTAQGE
jgi:hypothetical protein